MLALGLTALAVPAVAHPGHADEAHETGNDKGAAEPTGEEVAGMMRSLFKVEPLTAEQRARLPQAEGVIARMMPPGTLQQIMGGMFDKFLGPIMNMAGEPGSAEIASELGIADEDFDIADADAARIAAIIDPAWKERRTLEARAVQDAMSTMMTAMEPSMRKGMAEAYAATFTSAELTDVDRFFATPSGAAFARKSYALASDPRIMAAAMEGIPAVLAGMKDMESAAANATAKLPARRSYADLTPAQRAEIARIAGIGQGALREGMERVAAERAEKEAAKAEGASADDEDTGA